MPKGRTKSGKSRSPWAKWNPNAFKGKPKDLIDYSSIRLEKSKKKTARLDYEFFY